MTLYQPLLSVNWNLLFSVITVLVLFGILKHFFFEKVHNFMIAREEDVKNTLKNAEKTSQLADEKLANYEARIENVEKESRLIIKAARDEAKIQSKEIVNDANNKARSIMEHSEKEIRREEFNARKQLREEVSEMALMAAEKIMEKELSDNGYDEIVNDVIRKAEEEPWS